MNWSYAESEQSLPAAAPQETPAKYVLYFIAFQVLCQVALLVPSLGPLRMPLRVAAFAGSLALLVLARGRDLKHPSTGLLSLVIAVLAFSLLHPTGNTFLAALGQVVLNVAIAAPAFWAPRLAIDGTMFRRMVLCLFGFHSLSSLFGVLQVYFPGRFQPNLSGFLAGGEADYLKSLMITTSTGEMVFRPMGLSDVPGGAAMAGFYTILLGCGLLLYGGSGRNRLIYLGAMALGLAALLMSQVRSVLVMLACCLIVLLGALIRRGDGKKVAMLAGTLAALIFAGFTLAVALAPDSVMSRLQTLVADNPEEVYQQNRGHFLEATFKEYLPKFPLGAGLGRWGMMNAYFGDNSNRETEAMWVEIQWTGWLYDGGVLLMLFYTLAILTAFLAAFRIVKDRSAGSLSLWAAVVLAYNTGIFASTFNYPVFISQTGLEFWLLNASLYAAYRNLDLEDEEIGEEEEEEEEGWEAGYSA